MKGASLRVLAGVVVALTLLAGVAGTALHVDRIDVEMTLEEARVGAAALEAGGEERELNALLGDRWARSVLPPAPGPTAVVVPVHAPGSLEPVGFLEVESGSGRRGWSRGAAMAGVLALLGLGALWWAGNRGPDPRVAGLVLAVALALPLGLAQRWSAEALASLTSRRVEVGARGAAAILAPGPGGDREAEAARAAGLPWFRVVEGAPVDAWTIGPGIPDAVLALGDPVPATARIGGVPYHLAAVGGLRFARVGLEHQRSSLIGLVGLALAGWTLAWLILLLARWSHRPREARANLTAWAFLAPSALHLAAFTFGPLLFALWLSLHRWRLIEPARPFVGLANYVDLFRDPSWWSALGNTAVFTLHVPAAMAVALSLALITRGEARAVRWMRLALFLPTITSLVAVAVVWKWLLNDEYGLVNGVLTAWGLDPVRWLTSPDVALWSLMGIGVWLVVGYQMVLFQAGLAAIPREWYEAARVDGAGPWQRFWHITLPGLRHTLFFVLVTSVIGSFQVFGIVYVMTEGGPLGATDVAVYHIYREAWEFLRFGRAAAMSWLLFAVVFVATWAHFRLLERRGGHG